MKCKLVSPKMVQGPVDFLLDHVDVDGHWCLIHATHMSPSEITRVAKSGAVVGLCPTTEANLGDGLFSAEPYLTAGGAFGVGSDSHISISPRSELRMLEYGQRLTSRRRAVLGTTEHSVGRRLYQAACEGGAQALGINTGKISMGKRADIAIIDLNHPSIAAATDDRIFDRYVFCDAGNPVKHMMVGGTVD